MDTGFLAVDERTSLDLASHLAMNRPRGKLYDFIVVVGDSRYLGAVTVKNLLLRTAETEIAAARHLNPLSGLPGKFMIERQLVKALASPSKFSVAYLDIDNFRAYNDSYGFEYGDCVLRLLADKLKELISDACFIGHIGGDDFVAIVGAHIDEDFFSDVQERFRVEVLHFYHRTDIKNGCITACGSNNEPARFPLLDTTCVIASNKSGSCGSIGELDRELVRLQKKAKMRKLAKSPHHSAQASMPSRSAEGRQAAMLQAL
jgi:diguanylate cyclase (GGDEF)-like protein